MKARGGRNPGIGLAAICVLLAAVNTARAADTGGQAGAYLRAGIGARELAMGNAGTAAVTGAAAAYWNPAALVDVNYIGLASQTSVLGMERALNFLDLAYAGRTTEGRPFGLAASLINFSAGQDLEARSQNRPEPESLFGDAQNAITLGLATRIPAGVNLGASLKALLHQLGDAHGGGWGVDAAVYQRVNAHWRWGVVVQDVYSVLTWSSDYAERLPASVRAGVASGWLDGRLWVALDGTLEYTWEHGTVTDLGWRFGAEYRPWELVAVRAGLDSGRWTAGAGGVLPLSESVRLHLDYALAAEVLPDAGLTHVFSLGLDIRRPDGDREAGP